MAKTKVIKGTKKQARKRHRQAVDHRDRNRAVRTRVRKQMRKLRSAVASAEDGLPALVGETMSVIDSARRRGVLHRNTANRYKSRLARQAAKATVSQGA